MRATVRAHWPSPSALPTPISSRPSSGSRRRRPRRRRRACRRSRPARSSRALVPVLAVDLDRRLEGLRAEVLRRRPDVREAAEAVLQSSVGLADHPGVEAGSGHHGEPLAVDLADVQRARRDRGGRSRPPRAMSCGIPRLEAKSWRCRPGRSPASRRSRPARRRTAAPCRRRPRRTRARRPRPAPARRAPARTCSSAPRTRTGPRPRLARAPGAAPRARRRSSCPHGRSRRRSSRCLASRRIACVRRAPSPRGRRTPGCRARGGP